ncbi:RNA recognition motif domain [Arabidopsis thaliana x Arabidopsis arenosa]|uniref:RNA recognition motif domain n=1 Tax=Arabidopsis thaliana x Arabidopsis arenosa TaxID=1240361 RepID=A0A8T1Z1K8_9BRAS|nr:RNA recognition motif domain [Arabidopsis thaliana x Arabidopsis arenosa]
MAKEFVEKAKKAYLDDDFDVAVDLYSKAIELDPNCAAFFADRAQANIKLDNFTEAVADANKAIELQPTLAKAYLRKGTACMKLEEYRTAKAALEKGASVAPNEPKFKKMIDECDLRIAVPPGLLPPAPTPAAPAEPMFIHEFYQKREEAVVAIYAKGIPKENVSVKFGEQILSVVIDVAGEKAYHLQARLFGKIIPEKCRYEVLSTRVEIRLPKAERILWPALEYGKGQCVLPKPYVSSAFSQRPVYPSSNPKNVRLFTMEPHNPKSDESAGSKNDKSIKRNHGSDSEDHADGSKKIRKCTTMKQKSKNKIDEDEKIDQKNEIIELSRSIKELTEAVKKLPEILLTMLKDRETTPEENEEEEMMHRGCSLVFFKIYIV